MALKTYEERKLREMYDDLYNDYMSAMIGLIFMGCLPTNVEVSVLKEIEKAKIKKEKLKTIK